MICENCGHRISGAANFCPYCGRNNKNGNMPQDSEKSFEAKPENEFVAKETETSYTGEGVSSSPETEQETNIAVMTENKEENAKTSGNTASDDYYKNFYSVMEKKKNHNKAVASLVLGIVSVIMWLVPGVGLATSIIAIVLGASGRKKSPQDYSMATAGLVLGIVFLSLTCIMTAGRIVYNALTAIISFGF